MSDDLHTPYPPPPPPPDPTGTEPAPDPASGTSADAGADAGATPPPSDPKPTRANPGDWKRGDRGWRKMVNGVFDTLDEAADRVAEVTKAREMIEKDRQENPGK